MDYLRVQEPNNNHSFISKKKLQDNITQLLNRTEYSLNTVNNYRENIVHFCSSNNCSQLIEVILRKHGTEKADVKNKFGWTPLMQALREKHLDTVQLLINSGFHPYHRSYLGTSTLSIAAAAGPEAFECIFARYPVALNETSTDNISPLCIAAMKHDQVLFSRLLQLGVSTHRASEYTHFMMRQCVHEDIRKMAKPRLSVEDFWNNNDDNIEVLPQKNNLLYINLKKHDADEKSVKRSELKRKTPDLQLLHLNIDHSDATKESILSPNLMYNQNESYSMSPNRCFKLNEDKEMPVKRKDETLQNCHNTSFKKRFQMCFSQNNALVLPPNITPLNFDCNGNPLLNLSNVKEMNYQYPQHFIIDKRKNATLLPNGFESHFVQTLSKKYEKIRPPDLCLEHINDETHSGQKENLNATLGFIPDFEPVKTPNAPEESDDENAYGDKTPTPPRCSTPPTGIILSNSQNLLIKFLQAHCLDHHIAIFIEQEIDLDLFATLEDADLIDIGIKNENERKELLKAIKTMEQ